MTVSTKASQDTSAVPMDAPNSKVSNEAAAVQSRRMTVFYSVSFYWIVSISLVFLNKFSMTDVDAPIFLTWTQLVLAVFGCYVLSSLRTKTKLLAFFPDLRFSPTVAMRVLPLTITFVGMITFNNLCLKHVHVSFYQVARSLTIIFNVAFTYLVMGQKTSQRALLAVATVFIGYVIGSSSELRVSSLSIRGSIFGILSSLFVSLYAINVKRTMAHVGGNKWILMWYNNVIASLLMPPLILMFGEPSVLVASPRVYEFTFWSHMVLMTGVFGFLINIATYAQIQATSPLTHNISGTAKAGVQTLIALIMLREPIAFEGVFGLFLVLGGSLSYSYVRDREMNAAKAATYEPVKTNPDDVELGNTAKAEN